jgi:hypothetical protein
MEKNCNEAYLCTKGIMEIIDLETEIICIVLQTRLNQ